MSVVVASGRRNPASRAPGPARSKSSRCTRTSTSAAWRSPGWDVVEPPRGAALENEEFDVDVIEQVPHPEQHVFQSQTLEREPRRGAFRRRGFEVRRSR